MTLTIRVSLCNARYVRPAELDPGETVLFCQYLEAHPDTRHSWETVATVDREALNDLRASDGREPSSTEVEDVQCVLDWINDGEFDSVLEAILAAAHNRKRTIRGVRGFPDLERRRLRRG